MSKETTIQINITVRRWHGLLLGALVILFLFGGVSGCYQGRKISRITGRPVHIELPADVRGYDQIVSISFHKNRDGETIKDVTYMGSDGKLHSHEYNDWGIFQGEIIWELKSQE